MSSQGATVVSMLQTLRTFHKVEVLIRSFHPEESAAFQVANAPTAIAASAAVEQYIGKKWEFEDYGELQVEEVILLSVNPLSTPDPKLFYNRTLICNQPQPASELKQRRISFVPCEREESLHFRYGADHVYTSDGSEVFDWQATNDYMLQSIFEGSMVYVRLEEMFTLPARSYPPAPPPVAPAPPRLDEHIADRSTDEEEDEEEESVDLGELCDDLGVECIEDLNTETACPDDDRRLFGRTAQRVGDDEVPF